MSELGLGGHYDAEVVLCLLCIRLPCLKSQFYVSNPPIGDFQFLRNTLNYFDFERHFLDLHLLSESFCTHMCHNYKADKTAGAHVSDDCLAELK